MTVPCLLAFDTSTEHMALALVCPAGSFTHSAPGGAHASAALLPAAMALLRQAGLALADIQAVAFGRGPGAFTGLRTSCAVAQGLAWGIGCPVLPIDSLLLVAEDAARQVPAADDCADLDIGVAMDARMDEAYAARYQYSGRDGAWHVLLPPALYTVPALAAAWAGDDAPACVAGSALTAFGERLALPAATRRVPHENDRAAALAALALRAWAAGQAIDAAQALPLYLRDKVALTTLERAAVRDAAQAAAAGVAGAAQR
jgi:tRNA threonylcarbamoyladenosine biosynthesis protein TsaB